ncbi:MAG: tyrosine-type recombinase/integrase [Pseudomonadota bacterium]
MSSTIKKNSKRKSKTTKLKTTKSPKTASKRGSSEEPQEPWNKDRVVGQMRPFDPEQAAHVRAELEMQAARKPLRLRDIALFNVALDAMCRASEILSLRVRDVTDHLNQVIEEFEVFQEKTGRTKTVTLGKDARKSLQKWIDFSEKKPEAYLWSSIGNRKNGDRPLSRMQYSRLVKDWAAIARLDHRRFSTHSMRRTKSALIYDQTKNLRACQHLLGHKSIGSTAEYLGVDKKAALAVAKRIKI